MKKTLIGIAVLAVAAGALSFGAARWFVCRQCRPAELSVHSAMSLKRELRLTDAQAAAVEKCERQWRATMETFCAQHCAARFALGEEMAKPKPDLEKARAHVERMNAVQADSERATLEHIMKVRALLTAEQGQRYGSLIHHKVCAACPLGMHRPP